MNYQTISDIYEANDKIRAKLKSVLENLTDEQASTLPDGEKWTIKEFVEHIAIVDEGIIKISAKLLNKAKESGNAADGSIKFTDNFLKAIENRPNMKLEAPDRVRPTGTKSIAESLAKMDESRQMLDELKPFFESVECSDLKFPHPAFGELSAHDWLALLGGHEAGHLKQIKGLLEKID